MLNRFFGIENQKTSTHLKMDRGYGCLIEAVYGKILSREMIK
jgi:hypothetical protein